MEKVISRFNDNPNDGDAQGRFLDELDRLDAHGRLGILRKVWKERRDHFWLNTQLTSALQETGKYSRAVKLWSEQFEQDHSDHDIQNGLRNALKLMLPDRRMKTINALLKQHPESLFLLEIRGIAQFDARKFGEAIATFGKCLSEASPSAKKMKKKKTEYQLILTDAYRDIGDYDSCIAKLREILAGQPGEPRAGLRLSKVLISRRRYRDAVQVCINVLSKGKLSADRWHSYIRLLAKALDLKREPEFAVSTWTRLFEATTNPRILHRLSDALERRKDSRVVIDTWVTLLKTHPNLLSYCPGLSAGAGDSQHSINTVRTWKELLLAKPSEKGFIEGINRAFNAMRSRIVAIHTYKDILIAHPNEKLFYRSLRRLLNAEDDRDLSVKVWGEVSAAHSSNPCFRNDLTSARLKRDGKDEICPVCAKKEMKAFILDCRHTTCWECLEKAIEAGRRGRKLCPRCGGEIEEYHKYSSYLLVDQY